MVGKNILSQKPVSLPIVKRLMQERKKQGELSYEQNLTLEYSRKFSKLTEKQTDDLVKELLNANEKLDAGNCIALANIMPDNIDELRIILAKERFILSDEELNKLLEVVGNYQK